MKDVTGKQQGLSGVYKAAFSGERLQASEGAGA